MKSRLYFLIVFSFTFLFSWAGVSVRLQTPGSGGKVAVGQKFQIIVVASGSGGDLQAPNPQGAEVIYRTSNSESINGNFTSESTLTLLATTPGTYSFYATFGRQRSNVVKYTVTDASGSVPSSNPGNAASQSSSQSSSQTYTTPQSGPQFIGKGNENMFLRASVSKTNVYEQEAIVYTIKLYTTYQYIKFLGATAAPKFEGFVIEEDKVADAQQSFENYNGRTYKAAVVCRYIIFPQKAGKLKITGNTYTVSADAMEYYNDPYFQRMVVKRPVELNITPNDLVIDVKELPSPRPANFSGGVGKFSITSSLPSQSFKTNQAAVIKYTVSGHGNLKYINLPDLSSVYPSQLEVFTPESSINASVQGSTVGGSVVFTCSFMPVETGEFSIPPVSLVYFNPETGKYETSQARGYTIKVGQGSASDKSQTVRRFDSRLLPVGDLSKESVPWVHTFPFWLWFIIPSFGFVIALLWWIYYMRSHSDMEALMSRRAARLARKRLRKAADCLRRGDYGKFYDEMLFALWGYMGHKLKMPTSELTRKNILEVLTAHGVAESTATRAIALIDDCEFAKYSPSKDGEGMKSVYDRGASLISSLDSEFRRHAVDNSTHTDDDELF